MKIGKLFIGAQGCNGRREEFVVASWSDTTGYWRWAIYWQPARSWRDAFRLPRFGPSYAMGKRYRPAPRSGHFGAWCVLPLAGSLSISTQPAVDKC